MSDSDSIYRCSICGLHYVQEKDAMACQAYCSEYQACNLQLAARSVEAGQEKEI